MEFFQELRQQRWDDHRFYHQNRINQTLHLVSAMCFLASYVLIFTNPEIAVLIGWILAMLLRQAGHFFFEPKGFDEVNQTTHEYKERVKMGYNLQRKVVLLSIWALAAVALYVQPSFWGLFDPAQQARGFLYNLSIVWLTLAVAALLFRTVQLFFVKGIRQGLAWFTKIMTDPFHDIMIYYKAPYFLLRGEMLDRMDEWYDKSLQTGA